MEEKQLPKAAPNAEEERGPDEVAVADGATATEEPAVIEEAAAVTQEPAATDAQETAAALVGTDSEPDGADNEIAVTDIGTFGDHIIEDFSVESNVKKVSTYVKLPEKVVKYILSFLYIAFGAVCAAIPSRIESVLPYIVGGGMCAVSIIQLIFAIIQKEYRNTNSNRTASAIILIGLSIMIIIEHEWAHTFIPIVWGVFGLFEGAHAFNHALSRISRGMRSSYYIIKGVIEVVVAFLLLYEPESYGELHIIVFGVSLIIDGFTTIPIINKLFTRR